MVEADGTNSSRSNASLVPAAMLCCLIAGGISYILHCTICKGRDVNPVSPTRSMFTLTVISVSFFGPLTLINYFADFQSSSYTFVEFPTSVLLGVWYAGLIIIIFDIRDRQAKLQTEIAIQEMQFELARQSQLGISSKFSQQIKNVIQEKLKEGSSRLTEISSQFDSSPETASLSDISEELREINQQFIRPLSHRIIPTDDKEMAYPSWPTLIRNVTRTQYFHPYSMAILIYLSSTAHARIGLIGEVELIASLTILVLICKSGNVLMRRFPEKHAPLFVSTFAALQLNTIIGNVLQKEWHGIEFTFEFVLLEISFSAILVALTSTFPLWRINKSQELSLFDQSISDSRLQVVQQNHEISELMSRASKLLHGPVQSQLVACAMFLDSTDKNTPIGEIRNSLERARAAIDDHVVALADVTNFDGNSTLGEEVTKKVALWQGIMSVEVDLMPDVSILENPLAVHIAQIVEEALANASRHGNATSVGISLKRHDDSIVLVVNDNGSLIPVRKQGLGMAMVSQLSNGNYSLKASDSGTQLTVTLAIA
jgi:signal transduction histidine kinase